MRQLAAVATGVAAVGITAVVGVGAAPTAAAATCTDLPVVCENQLAGSPSSEWDVPIDDDTIQGFATDISVNAGSPIQFKIKTDAAAYSITIYRLGWYGGDGARRITTLTPSATLPQTQPACLSDAATGLYDCGNWAVSAGWTVPPDAVSGVYLAKLSRPDTGAASHIPFVVRNDASTSDVVFQTSDTTWQAYNTYGGSSFYTGPNGRAVKLSYNRPFDTRGIGGGRDYLFGNEYPTIRFLERNGYDVSYISGLDTYRSGSLLLNHKVFLSVGHDEYWAGGQRSNVEAARDAGVNLAFFSGNEVYWKTRWEPSTDGSATANRTLVCYKETWDNAKTDPSAEWTGTWRDPRFSPPSDGGRPENSLTGTAYMSNFTDLAIQVSAAEGKRRFWRNTAAASLPAGQTLTLADHTVGYESDEDLDNGFRPAGMIRLSTTTGATPQYLRDFGNTVTPGTTTHHLTLYRAASGALVFGAGTVQWAWGLDSEHDADVTPPAADVRMQQATVNLLADMRAQPRTLMSTLTPATASTDAAGPVVTITSPAAGSTFANGSTVTVTGTAADAGGGVVAGVEVSTDGGTRWRLASGTTSWTYSFTQQGAGPTDIRVRATDDSVNTGAVARVTTSAFCPCNALGNAVPTNPDAGDGSAVELGVRFTPTTTGWITGVRFYKSAANTGTHTGSVWSTSGARLATGTFTNETASGWQTLVFDAPVAVTAGTSYVASYFAPNGHYAADPWYFSAADVSAPPITLNRSRPATPNGLFEVGAAFPSRSFRDVNYWVDVVFDDRDTYPPTVTASTPLGGSSSVASSVRPTATFGEAVQASSISFTLTGAGGAVASGNVAYDAATRVATFTPAQPLARGVTYTATVSATDTAGNVMRTPYTWLFTTAQPSPEAGVCPCSIWDDAATPDQITVNDAKTVELGVKFTAETDGQVTGIRFYKGPQNTGTHTGTLWTAGGQQLATATFTGESTTGWQTVTFAAPVTVTAGTTYVASYRTNVGYYSATVFGFAGQGVSNPPLQALANGGAFVYGGGFPSEASTANYWVDVVFSVPPGLLPTVTSVDPPDQSTNVPVGQPVSAVFSTLVQPSSPVITVTGPAGAVTGSTTYSATARRATFTPAQPLAAGTTYTMTVSGARNLGGGQMTPSSTTFTTSGPNACPCTLFASAATPAVVDSGDGNAVTLGVKVVPTVDGFLSGVRFYKSSSNVGPHTGAVWSSLGVRLASVTFTGESGSGWQTASFAQPVSVTAGTTYVVGYFAPSGRYSVTSGFFASPWQNGLLGSPAGASGNGLFAYGSSETFPSGSFGSSNYWVDAIFSPGATPDTTPPTVSSVAPLNGATSVPSDVIPSAVLAEDVAAASVQLTLTTAAGDLVAGTVGYDVATRTATFTPGVALARGVTYTASVRATDLAGNAMTTPVTWSFTTAKPSPAVGVCPCSLWDDATQPAVLTAADVSSVELGLTFVPSVDGQVTGVRFFKGPQNTGTHTGTLWSAGGQQLATATFTAESTTGWQTVSFAAPVTVTAGTVYVVSYRAPNGRYSVTAGGLAADVVTGPLRAPAGNAVFTYGTGMPTTVSTTNYWVDPVFVGVADTTPPSVVSRSPLDGATSVPTGTTVTAVLSEDLDLTSLQLGVTTAAGAVVGGTTSYDAATRTATFTPSAALARGVPYTASVRAADRAGNLMAADRWSFTTAQPSPTAGVCPCSLWDDATQPAVSSVTDNASTELGLTFVPSLDGQVTGVRFFKGARNTGTHTGTLWTAAGTQLATATFSGESTTGWQTVSFATPVTVTAGTSYVVSYRAPNGGYASTTGGLAADVVTGPLKALAGRGLIGTGTGVPTAASTTNYWVDPVFVDNAAPTVLSRSPLGGATSVPTGVTPSAVLSEDVSAASVQATVSTSAGAAVAGAASYDAATRTVTFTPSAALSRGVAYTVSVRATDLAGNAMAAPVSWSFTTAQPSPTVGVCPCSLWDDGTQPALASVTDTASTELGVTFVPSVDGLVTGVRFFKGAQNTGTHTGTLWSATGTQLATATFGGESTTGWQTVSFATPVRVTAGTSYVVSYRAPNGGYATTVGGLAADVVTGPLRALAGRGLIGTGAGVPATASTTNYWVDPVFLRDTTAPVVSGLTATGSGTTATITWTTDEPATSTVLYGTSATALTSTATAAGSTLPHTVTLTGLTRNTRYYYRVVSADPTGNSTTFPATTAAAAQYVPTVTPLVQTAVADFTGTVNSGYVAANGDGEVVSAPTAVTEMSGTALPTGWTSANLVAGGSTVLSGGVATVTGARLTFGTTGAASRGVSALATLTGTDQRIGLWSSTITTVGAWFTVNASGQLVAVANDGLFNNGSTVITGSFLNTPRTYRVDWTSGSVAFFVNDVQVATRSFSPLVTLRPMVSDPSVGNGNVSVDWIRLSPYTGTATYTSPVLDGAATVGWDAVSWDATVPTGTTLVVAVRTGNTATPDATWSAFTTVASSGAAVGRNSRYLQYRLTLTTSGTRLVTPAVRSVSVGLRVL